MDLLRNNKKAIILKLNNVKNVLDEYKENEIIGEVNIQKNEIILKKNIKKIKFSINIEKIRHPKHIIKKNIKDEYEYLTSIKKIGSIWKEIESAPILEVEKTNSIQVIRKDDNDLKLPNAKLNLFTGEDALITYKMEKDDIKEELFYLFGQKSEMFFDEINLNLRQPESYLNSILNEICDKRREKNKFIFFLKQRFTTHNEVDYKKKFKNK